MIKLDDINITMRPHDDPKGCELIANYSIRFSEFVSTEQIKRCKFDIIKRLKETMKKDLYEQITGHTPICSK